MECTCGASGGMDGHAYSCGLRTNYSSPNNDQGLNRVMVGLPNRLNNAKEALKDYELTLVALRSAYAQRGVIPDQALLDRIGSILND